LSAQSDYMIIEEKHTYQVRTW